MNLRRYERAIAAKKQNDPAAVSICRLQCQVEPLHLSFGPLKKRKTTDSRSQSACGPRSGKRPLQLPFAFRLSAPTHLCHLLHRTELPIGGKGAVVEKDDVRSVGGLCRDFLGIVIYIVRK